MRAKTTRSFNHSRLLQSDLNSVVVLGKVNRDLGMLSADQLHESGSLHPLKHIYAQHRQRQSRVQFDENNTTFEKESQLGNELEHNRTVDDGINDSMEVNRFMDKSSK
jgi:hypothetical protein